METSVKVFMKNEVSPVGDVIGLVVLFRDDRRHGFQPMVVAESYYAKENDQKNVIRHECMIAESELEILALKPEYLMARLIRDMKHYHKVAILSPLSSNLYSKGYVGLDPYDDNKNPWLEYDESSILGYIDYYKSFFDYVITNTRCSDLQKAISVAGRIKIEIDPYFK
jgi:hypothetical protein